MEGGLSRHDREADTVDRETTVAARTSAAPVPTRSEQLQAAVDRLTLHGATFLRAEYREPWAYDSLTGPATANLLQSGSDRVILFHVVASGRCWVSVAGGPRHWARAGDVIVLPYGDQHRMGGVGDADSVPIESFMTPPPWTHMPVLRHGAEDGNLTDVVCGYLHSRDTIFDPDLRVFPPVFVVTPPAGAAADWVRANIAFALEQTRSSPAPSHPPPSATRLPELLLVEVLRLHLATAPAVDDGWAQALTDPVLSPAIAMLHRSPERKWTVAELARATAVSRSLLDARFRQVLGRSPIRYLTDWRMHLAQDLLATTDLGVVAVARRVGYEAEESFSRAFKRAHGIPPGAWRAQHSQR